MAAIFGRSTYPLPFSHIEPAEPFLDRAIKRIGHAPDPDRKDEQFYSYFSEMWAEGYEDGLAQQHNAYCPHLKKNHKLPFLDIGCGAGEFIQFLNTQGISAIGIDSDANEVIRAKNRGLNVHCVDAMSYLKENKESFSGITLIEVIEHLPPDSLAPLLTAIINSLASGGIALLETINAKNQMAFNTFYSDPTHTRPIPSDYLVFLMQWTGFKNIKIIYTSPMAFNREQSIDPSRAYFSYAVIATK